MPHRINIAIDGYSSTGKSTLARELAKKLNYRYIDTGAMYRAVTLYAVEEGMIKGGTLDVTAIVSALATISVAFEQDSTGTYQICLNGTNVEPKIRSMLVAKHVSEVAAISAVRRFLVEQQMNMALKKGVVMDGRDIGTVVLPKAELKIFVTAASDVRVDRRLKELQEKGLSVTKNEVAENLATRDKIDTTREDSPLRQAADARLLDNSNISREEQLKLAFSWARDCQREFSS